MKPEEEVAQELAHAVGEAAKQHGATHVTQENTNSLAAEIRRQIGKANARYYAPLIQRLIDITNTCAVQGDCKCPSCEAEAEIERLKTYERTN